MKFPVTRIAVLLLLSVAIVFGQSSQDLIHQKLHPVFQSVVAGAGATSFSKTGGGLNAPISTLSNGKLLYDAIITTTDANAVRALGIHVNSAFNQYVTAQVTREDILNLIQRSEVKYLDPGTTNYPMLDLSNPETGANLLHAGLLNRTPYKGKGVIIVIFDSGIDWRHLDFRDPTDTTKSRILSIWDQTLTPTGTETTPSLFSYGVEYTKQQIEAELSGATKGFVREKDINGHGTHVAGIATGNGNSYFKKYVGVAPEADIIVVKGGDGSFTSTRIIDGLSYASSKAASYGKPVVMNLSLGGQSGPHDGTSAYETAINSFVSSAGKVVTVSAGNDGDDLIHISGNVSPGNTTSISVTVPAYTPNAGTNNDRFELDIWFSNPLGITAETVSPTPNSVHLQVSPNNTNSTSSADGSIDMYNYNSGAPNFTTVVQVVASDNPNAPKTGVWTINLTGANASSSFDAWLSSTSLGGSYAYLTNGDNNKTVAMPGTSDGAITVASYVTKTGWPSIDGNNWVYSSVSAVGSRSTFSSIGPTADGRHKPDISAPGQGVGSSLSASVVIGDSTFILPGKKDQLMQGTSQAAPHVAGAAALLLQVSPSLTATQIKGLLTTTATSDAATGSGWNAQYGNGKMDILAAAAKAFNPASSVQRQTLSYDVDGSNQIYVMTGSTANTSSAPRYAVRFTPSISGQVVAMQLNLTTTSNRPIQGAGPLVCEVWSNSVGSLGGIPGTKLGNTVLYPFQRLSTGTNNYIDLSSSGVNVTAGQDYHLVIGLSSQTDTIKVRSDTPPAVPTNRSSVYDGTQWKNLLQLYSTTASNLRMRAVVLSASGLVSVENVGTVPRQFELAQNYPNPFNPSTSIRYSVPVQSRIRLRVYDLIGREVAILVDDLQAPGSYQVNWHGTDNLGVPLPSGVYFYRLESTGSQLTKKMILLK